MNRSDLAHVLRAASRIVDDTQILVIGSQAILGSFSEESLPAEATRSIEVDVAFFDDPDHTKADMVDGAIGEASAFHQEFGVYGQGVSLSTAVLPEGWRGRLVRFADPVAGESAVWCLDPHDLVVSKLVAGREKDRDFAWALIRAGLVDADLLLERGRTLPVLEPIKRRVLGWLDGVAGNG